MSHDGGTNWADSAGTTSIVAGGKVTLANVSASGSYRLVVALTGNLAKSCVKTSTAAVVVIKPKPSVPTVTMSPNKTTFCAVEAHTLTAASTVTGGTSIYTWKLDAIGTGATKSGLTTVGTHNYRVVASLNGCSDSASKAITVIALPDSTIAQAGPFCASGAPFVMSAASPGGAWKVDATAMATSSFDPKLYSVGSHLIHYNVSSGGCSSHDTITVVINPQMIANITTSDTALCKGTVSAQIKLSTNTSSGGTWVSTPTLGLVTNTGMFNAALSGTGVFKVYYAKAGFNVGCSAADSVKITVSKSDTAKITTAQGYCQGQGSVLLQKELVSNVGTWSGTGITNAATGAFNAGLGSGNYLITYTTSGACSAKDTATVKVYGQLISNIVTADTTLCKNAAPTQIRLSSNTSSGGTWLSTPTAGLVSSTGVFTASNIGVYKVYYGKVGATLSCSAMDSAQITVSIGDTAKITTAQGYCQGQGSVLLQKELVSNVGTWSGTGITNAATGAFNAGLGSGNYLITYTTSGACSAKDTATVKVYGQLISNIVTADTTLCKNAAPTQIRLSSNTSSGGTWLSTPTAGLVSSTGVFTASNIGVYKVYYGKVGATLSCSAMDSVQITVGAKDTAKITLGQGPFCLSDPAQILLKEGVSSAGSWTGTGITNAGGGNFNPAAAGVGAHKITYTTSGACVAKDTLTVNVVNLMVADIAKSSLSLCADTSLYKIVLNAGTTPGGVWSSVPAGVVDGDGKFSAASGTAGTKYMVYYTLTGATPTCSAKDSIEITLVQREDAAIVTAAQSLCFDTAPLTLQVNNAGGTWTGKGLSGAAGAEVFDPAAALLTGAGPYVLTYKLNGASGLCPNTKSVSMSVIAMPDTSISATGPFCLNSALANLRAATNGGLFSGDGVVAGGVPDQQVYDPALAGVGKHTLTYIQGVACPVSSSITVEVDSVPQVLIVPDVTSGCVPLTISFGDSSSAAVANATWDFGDGETMVVNSANASVKHTYKKVGNSITARLNIEFVNGCKDFGTQKITVSPVPVADFSFGPLPASTRDPLVTFVNESSGDDQHIWYFGSKGSPDTSMLPIQPVVFSSQSNDTIPVMLIARNASCADTIIKKIYIKDIFTLYMADAFSPNDDGVNDFFMPGGINHICDDCKNYEFLIFNRWGEVVYKTNNPTEAWNGKRANTMRDAEIDVYVWQLTYTDSFTLKPGQRIGHVTLIR